MINREDMLELTRRMTLARTSFSRIAGCYIDKDGDFEGSFNTNFLKLSAAEKTKKLKLAKAIPYSETNVNLKKYEIPQSMQKPGSMWQLLMTMNECGLKNDALMDTFYDIVMESYRSDSEYAILVFHGRYDIPLKAADKVGLWESEEVFEYMICAICPLEGEYEPGDPECGFLFPAFNDRSTDLHSVLYYTKKSEDLQPEMIDQLLGAKMPMSADTQKETFQMIIEDTLGEDGDYETVRNIHETLNELIEEHKEDPDPLSLDKTDVKKIFEQSGVSNEKMENFDQNFEENAGEKASLLASNIAETKKFNIETPDVVIKVNPERMDLVETRMIDGRQCLVIPVDDHIEVNGLNVRTMKIKTE